MYLSAELYTYIKFVNNLLNIIIMYQDLFTQIIFRIPFYLFRNKELFIIHHLSKYDTDFFP